MTSNNIQPTDDLLNELNEPRADRTWTIAGLTTEYPWESDEQYEQFLNAANRTTLTPENRHSLTEKISEISDRRHNLFWQNNSQEKNDVTDAILRATGLYEEHEAYNENSIHADVSSIRNGITVQQWLNALKAFDKLNVDDYSDGHIVNYWYGMETDQVVIHINHKHWLENDKTAYIRMTAYEQIEFEGLEPSEQIGSAIVIWPWT